MKRILTILAAIACLCSCEKENVQDHWLFHAWGGVYETTVIDNETGESRAIEAFIDLRFTDDRSECTVTRGYSDETYEVTKNTYCVDLFGESRTFCLKAGPGDSEIVYTSHNTENGTILTWHEDAEEISVELFAHKVE